MLGVVVVGREIWYTGGLSRRRVCVRARSSGAVRSVIVRG